jgi:hypothetical protein
LVVIPGGVNQLQPNEYTLGNISLVVIGDD